MTQKEIDKLQTEYMKFMNNSVKEILQLELRNFKDEVIKEIAIIKDDQAKHNERISHLEVITVFDEFLYKYRKLILPAIV